MTGLAEPRVDLVWVLTATDDEILEHLGRWYIADRNVDVIRRTALVVLGNTASPTWGRDLVVDLLAAHLAGDRDLLRRHAVWAARRLGLDGSSVAMPVCCNPAVDVADCPEPELHIELTGPVEPRFEPSAWAAR